MGVTKWMFAGALAILMLPGTYALAQGHGHGKGHNKHQGDDEGDYYRASDREYMRRWYDDHQSNLPPGLAKKDRLPPGLEKQLVSRGTLPPGYKSVYNPAPKS